MNYKELKDYLLGVFKENDFEGEWKAGRIHRKVLELENENNMHITIKFPGKKTQENEDGFKYDYLVEFNQIQVSHAHIVIDIYNKISQYVGTEKGDELIQLLYNYLNALVLDGHEIDLKPYIQLDNWKFTAPNEEMINLAQNIHKVNDRPYDIKGNERSFSIQELTRLIPYIAVQEDINYPYGKGRKLSFYRYMESILCNCQGYEEHSLNEVIMRTLQKKPIPPLWNCPYYKEIDKVSIR